MEMQIRGEKMIEQYLESGRYKEALDLLQDRSDENTRYARLICLYGLQEYEPARKEAELAMDLAEDTYYDVVSIYVSILKELQEFDKAIDLLVKELSMPYIPYQYETTFNEAYDALLLEKQEVGQYNSKYKSIFNEEEIEQVLVKDTSDDVLYMVIDQMESMNIRLLLPAIRIFLKNPNRPNLAKSLIIEILTDQQVDEEMVVVKGHATIPFNPFYLTKVQESEFVLDVGQILSDHIEDDNPSLFNTTLEFLCMFVYDHYPSIDEDKPELVAAAIHYYIATLQYLEADLEDICFQYGCNESDLLEKIEELEKIEM